MISPVKELMKHVFASAALLLFLSGLLSAPAQSIENAAIEGEEYAVYSAVIPDYAQEETGVLVIANPTSSSHEGTKLKDLQFLPFPSAPVTALSQETLDDFVQRNKSNRWLAPKFEMSRKYTLVDFREIKRLANDFSAMDQEWKALFQQYPASHGFVTLSRVGFNQRMDQALAWVGWNCPGLCGHWSYLLLVKRDGAWKLAGEANRIVS